jgi:hypothetical protein
VILLIHYMKGTAMIRTIVKESNGGDIRAEIVSGDDMNFKVSVYASNGQTINELTYKNSNLFLVESNVRNYLDGIVNLNG